MFQLGIITLPLLLFIVKTIIKALVKEEILLRALFKLRRIIDFFLELEIEIREV